MVLSYSQSASGATAITWDYDAEYMAINNSYIGLAIGYYGSWKLPTPPYYHWQISQQPASGRFQIWTTGGDPSTSDDDNTPIIYSNVPSGSSTPGYPAPGDKWAAWQVMVDTWSSTGSSSTTGSTGTTGNGTGSSTGSSGLVWSSSVASTSNVSANTSTGNVGITSVNIQATGSGSGGTTTDHKWATFTNGGSSAIWGDEADGVWVVRPYIPTTNDNTLVGSWVPKDTSSGVIPVLCNLESKIMRDTVRFKWTITNYDTTQHLVGLRVYADLATPSDVGTDNGRTTISVPGRPLVTDETLLSGNDIPSSVEFFDSASDPKLGIRATFKGEDATPPDKVGIDNWEWTLTAPGGVSDSDTEVGGHNWSYGVGTPGIGEDAFCAWLYTPPANHYIEDVAYGAFWKPRLVGPGQTITIVHYLGLASATSVFNVPSSDNPQYVASVLSPRALKYYTDSVTGAGKVYPDPFTITANVVNTEQHIDLMNPSFSLILPSGLQLDSSEQNRTSKSLSRITAGDEGSVSWKVTRASNAPSGKLKYSVVFTANPVGGTTITREISVPASQAQTFSPGWQMISVPFQSNNPDPGYALGLSGNYSMYRYNTHSKQYETATALVSGEAYWLYMGNPAGQRSASMPAGSASALSWTDNQGQQISLQSGWNLIGNPFVYSVTLGELRFYYRNYGTLTYDEAVDRGLLYSTLYWWDPIFRRYNWSSDRNVELKPWQGYWVKALASGLSVFVTPESQIGASVGGTPTDTDSGSDIISPPASP